VGGWIFDKYKSYTPAFELNAVLAAVGILAIVFAAMPKPRGEVGAVLQQEVAR
jgi:hypothetical protein